MAKSYKSVSQLSTLEADTFLFSTLLLFFFFAFVARALELVLVCILFDCYDYLAITKLTKLLADDCRMISL